MIAQIIRGGAVMGEVIVIGFQKRQSRDLPAGSAEILFFTGVRYQRAVEEAPQPLNEPQPPEEDGKPGGVGGAKRRRRS